MQKKDYKERAQYYFDIMLNDEIKQNGMVDKKEATPKIKLIIIQHAFMGTLMEFENDSIGLEKMLIELLKL